MINLNSKYLKTKYLYSYKKYGKNICSYKIIPTIENCVLNGRSQPFLYQIDNSIKIFFLINNFFKIENDLENNNLLDLDFEINAIFLTNQNKNLYPDLEIFKRKDFKLKYLFKKGILKINMYNFNGFKVIKTHIALSPEYNKLEEVLANQNLPKDLILR